MCDICKWEEILEDAKTMGEIEVSESLNEKITQIQKDILNKVQQAKYATVSIGPYRFKKVKILKVEMDSGAINGWYTCEYNGLKLLFAGEELIHD